MTEWEDQFKTKSKRMRTLLVVGRSSNGKSSVGNSILCDQVFSPRGPTEGTRLTNEKRSNNEYIVVDCSGIGDTEGDIAGGVQSIIQSALEGLMLCDSEKEMTLNEKHHKSSGGPTLCNYNIENQGTVGQYLKIDETLPSTSRVDDDTQSSQVLTDDTQSGPEAANDTQSGPGAANDTKSGPEAANDTKSGFDALIFVQKYGVRFTKQEKDAVQMVKSIFGENVFRDRGMLIFSYGDNFYLDTEDDGMTFEDWCREQTGDIQTLFEEVGYRCVLFDNKTRDEKKQNSQREQLTTCITKIVNSQKGKYTHAEFVSAGLGKVKLLLQGEFKGIEREVQRLIHESDEAAREMEEIHSTWLSQWETLKQMLRQLLSEKEKLETKDQGTGLLQNLVIQVTSQIWKIKSTSEKVAVGPGRHVAHSEISIVSPGGSKYVTRESDAHSRGFVINESDSEGNDEPKRVQKGCSGRLHWFECFCCCRSAQDRYKTIHETQH